MSYYKTVEKLKIATLTIKNVTLGVVFNEMKGAFADSQTIFGEAMLNSVLPSNTYGVL